MWVQTKDDTNLINCYSFQIQRTYGEKGKKYAIIGEYAHNFWGGSFATLETYAKLDDAKKDLEKLNKSIVKGEKVFKF